MKVALLTTETIHHLFFIRAIAPICKEFRVFLDTESMTPPFPIAHAYETERDNFERSQWFNGNMPEPIQHYADCVSVAGINTQDAIKALKAYHADITIVFGTRKLNPVICEMFAGRLVNLHGGDPEKYRGLDSHLWSLYHQDRTGLVTALHEINPVLDDGNIIATCMLNVSNITQLVHLRKENMEVCVKLVSHFLQNYFKDGRIRSTPQQKIGRYYSFMPTVLKDIVYTNFINGKYESLLRPAH